jgi:tetratricopeptide (TPR) repeat protein
MSLLKDVFATISPIATRKRPTLRLQLLREFRQGSERKLGANHVLTELFHILCREEGSDELSVAVLRAMLEETRRILQPQHPELFELQRTLVRLYRRIRYMTEAELSGWSLVEASENIYGKNHVNTRLALSECVYIYNDNGRYDNALSIAEDILHRAQLNLGQDYPDYQSIYAMEDVAEVCDNLGRINDAIDWLRKASRAALKVWGDQSSTVHILDKLDVLHDKRYQQALRL